MIRASTSMFAGPRAAILWVAPILLATAGTAAAAPTYSINANLSTPAGVESVIGSQGAPIVDNQSQNIGIPGAAVSVGFGALAAPGMLGSSSTVGALAPGAIITGSDNSIVDFALDNLKIVDPLLLPGTQVLYRINFTIDGAIVVSAFGNSNANANVELDYGASPLNLVTLGTAFASTIGPASGGSGIFSGGVAGVIAQTPLQTGFIGQDAYAEFSLATHAGATASPSINEQGQASAEADFLDPFSFSTDGPVFSFFDLNGNPLAGVTVDSGDGCIVNNVFLCGAAAPPPTPVPEPSTWAMLLVGLAGLGYTVRQARKARA